MKLTHLFFTNKPDHRWQLCKQMGVDHAFAKLATDLTGNLPPWDYDSLAASVRTFERAGLELIGLEGDQFDMSRIKRGLPGRDEDIERYGRMLENMGQLGIRTLCYNFMVTGWYRTAVDVKERGDAIVTAFNWKDAEALPPEGEPITAKQLWENYEYFITRVIPIAESVGVTMALHPCDPPVSSLRGIARIFTSAAAVDRALTLVDSPSHALTFCQGTYTTMGEDVPALAQKWGAASKIAFLHIRDVVGTPADFRETFHDNGPTDMSAMFRLYKELGLNCPLRSDHVPTMADEANDAPGYGMSGNLFGIGYIKGLLDATE